MFNFGNRCPKRIPTGKTSNFCDFLTYNYILTRHNVIIMSNPAFNFSTNVEIRFADLDAFGHVNNAIYLTYFEIARSKYWRDAIQWDWKKLGIIIARAEVDYIKQLTVRDTAKVYVRTSRVGTSSFDLQYVLVSVADDGSETIVAKGMTVCVAFNYNLQLPSPIPEAQKKAMELEIASQP